MRSARRANPNNLTPLQVAILRSLHTEPCCDGTIAHLFRRHPGTIAKRRLELQRAGLVKNTPDTELTPYGAPATVHALTKRGERVVARYDRKAAA